MKKYYKLLLLPAILMIVAGIFSGFSNQTNEQVAKELLQKRTEILQKAFYGTMEKDQAETKLREIETFPLLTDDIYALRNTEATELDQIKRMNFNGITVQSELFHYVSFDVQIVWEMIGASGEYRCDGSYSVVMKSMDGVYKLSEFNAK